MGLDSLLQQNMQNAGLAGIDRLAGNAMYPQSHMDKTQYAVPSQMPTSAEVMQSDYDTPTQPYTGMQPQMFADGGDVEDKDIKASYSVTPQGTQEYDPRFMPLQMDNRPLTGPQAALLRFQLEKELGQEGRLRAAAMGSVMAVPGQSGLRGMPGQFEVGYNTPVGVGNLDISAMRAMRGTPDGKVPYGVNARYSIPFAEGGVATLRYDDGGNVSQMEEPVPEPVVPPTMAELATQLNEYYRSNQNYDDTWKQFAATKEQDPQEWYRHQLGFLGGQQGWQIGQNTSERNAAGLPAIQDTIVQAKAAGLSDPEIANILDTSNQAANIENQNRIIRQQQAGGGAMGMTTQDYLTVAAILGGGAAAAYFGPALAAAGAAEGAGAIGAVGATGAGATTAASTTPAWMAAAGKGAAIGAAMGGGSAAVTGGNVGQGIIRGGITGAVGGGAGSAMGGGYLGNMAGGALAGGAGSALRGGNIAQGAGMGALGGAISSGISGLDAPDAVKYGLNAFGKPLVMSQLGSAMGGSGGQSPSIPGSTTGTYNGGYGINTMPSGPSGSYGAFSPTPTMGAGALGYTGTLGPAVAQGTNPFAAQYAIPKVQLSRLSDFDGYAEGGMTRGNGIVSLGSYSDGGHLLKGPGDGMSDDIPAKIGSSQPARLADGEFVVPADVVSHLGNGSTDAGAKQLYKMMDKIRHARTGNKKQGKRINPDKYLP